MKCRKLNPKELDEIMNLIISTQGHLGYANGAMENFPDDAMSEYLQYAADNDANESLQRIYDIIFNTAEMRKEGQEFIKARIKGDSMFK